MGLLLLERPVKFCKSLFFSAVFAVLTLSVFPSFVSAEQAWKLEQKSLVLGRENIYTSSRHLRIDILDKNLVLYSSAPDWNISIYSPSRKCIYKSTFKKWPSSFVNGLLVCYGAEFAELKWLPLKSAKSTVPGLSTLNFCSAANPRERQNLYQVAEKGFMPEQAARIVLKLYGLDRSLHLPSQQFPLFVSYLDSEQSTSVVLKTLKCTSVDAGLQLFSEPSKGMRLVAKEWDLVEPINDY